MVAFWVRGPASARHKHRGSHDSPVKTPGEKECVSAHSRVGRVRRGAIPWKVRLFAVLLHELREQGGPPRLVACADARAVVAVKIFVKENQVSPMGIGLESLRAAIERPPAVAGAQEDSGQPM